MYLLTACRCVSVCLYNNDAFHLSQRATTSELLLLLALAQWRWVQVSQAWKNRSQHASANTSCSFSLFRFLSLSLFSLKLLAQQFNAKVAERARLYHSYCRFFHPHIYLLPAALPARTCTCTCAWAFTCAYLCIPGKFACTCSWCCCCCSQVLLHQPI